jgi:hypothetical protein
MADSGEGEAIEGGSTTEDVGSIEVTPPRDPERHRQAVTFLLIGLLVLVIVGHYVCVVVLVWNGKKAEAVDSAYNNALPVVAGLVGSAVTYYFARDRSR